MNAFEKVIKDKSIADDSTAFETEAGKKAPEKVLPADI